MRCCTGDLIADLEAGRIAIGYNLLGSYVYPAMRRGARIGLVVPRDYTLVLSRAVLVPVTARAVGDAFAFVDYLLSARGQKVSREEAFFFDRTGPLPSGGRGSAEPRHRRHPAADHRRAGAARGAGPGQARPLPRRVAPVDRRGGAPRRAATGGAVTLPAPPRIAPLRARAESA